jgi:hypothetical protein
MTTLRSVNYIVSVGSVDGVCTTAAVLRNANSACGIEFCQAFTVDRIDPTTWESNRTVLFVDLGVNNRDPEMTNQLLRRVVAAGHTIVGVLDEHNHEDWAAAFAAAELDFAGLAIKPVSGKGTSLNSSGALLLSLFGDQTDSHTRELCEAADAADRMDYSTHFGGCVNSAVKSRIGDDSRRVHLARHFATHTNPDATIVGWIEEYEAILVTHEEVLSMREDLGNGIVRIDTIGRVVDVTTLMSQLYELGAKVTIIAGEVFNPATGLKEQAISFGLPPQIKGLDLLAKFRAAGLEPRGMAQKATVGPEDEALGIAIVRVLFG